MVLWVPCRYFLWRPRVHRVAVAVAVVAVAVAVVVVAVVVGGIDVRR